MEHEHSDDEWGFWEPERTRRLPRIRPRDDDTRPLAAVRPGSRRHADAHVDAEEPVDEHDPLGLFDELGPADEFPGLDDEPEVEVVATGRRSWRDLFRRNARGRPDPLVVHVGAVVLAGLIAVPILASSSGGASTAGAAMIPPTTITAANPAPVTEFAPHLGDLAGVDRSALQDDEHADHHRGVALRCPGAFGRAGGLRRRVGASVPDDVRHRAR